MDSFELKVKARSFMRGPAGAAGADGSQGPAGAAGISPVIQVSDITGGHRLTIIDAEGVKYVDIMNATEDGEVAGADGISPTVGTATVDGGTQVTITDVNGVHVFTVLNGLTPVKGTDYFTVEDIAEIVAQIAAGEKSVSYVPQTLTAEQQVQARANIGAVDLSQVNQIVNAAVSAVSLEAMDEVIG